MLFTFDLKPADVPDRETRTTEPADTGQGVTTVDAFVDTSAPGSGASTPPPDYPADPGLRRFVRRGYHPGFAGDLRYALGKFIGVAAPTGQAGLRSAEVTEAQSSPNERRTPTIEHAAPAPQQAWYDTFVTR